MPPEPVRELPPLQTEHLTLRALRHSDAPDIFALAQDPEVTRLTRWSTHTSIQDSQAFLNFALEQFRTGVMFPWGITEKPVDEVVGTAGLANYDAQNARAELGFALARRLWNRGLATEAARAVIVFGFKELQLSCIEARCNLTNHASVRVLDKLGMTFSHNVQEHIKGELQELRLYVLSRQEFFASESWDVKL